MIIMLCTILVCFNVIVADVVTDVGTAVLKNLSGAALDTVKKDPKKTVQDVHAEGERIKKEVTTEQGKIDYGKLANVYIDRWKETVQKFDWQKLKVRMQEEFGLSGAGKLSEIWPLPMLKMGVPALRSLEQEMMQKRVPQVLKGIKAFTGLGSSKPITIAIACAGPGYEGMVASGAFLSALDDVGLLDCSSYCAASSGATWMVGPWYFNQLKKPDQKKPHTFIARLADKIAFNQFDWFGAQRFKDNPRILPNELKTFITECLLPKVVFDQVVSAVDFLGALLALFLLDDFGDQKYMSHMSSVWNVVADGTMPWPIFTAISMNKTGPASPSKQEVDLPKDESAAQENVQAPAANQAAAVAAYHVYEFNPEDVRNLSLKNGFDIYAFDKKFINGSTKYKGEEGQRIVEVVDLSLETSFASLMALCGSKYALNWRDIKNILLEGKEPNELIASVYKKPVSWVTQNITQIPKLLIDVVKTKGGSAGAAVNQTLDKLKAALFVKAMEAVAIDKTFTIGGSSFTLGGTLRLSPAQVRNPYYQYAEKSISPWLQAREYLTYVDASFFYDVPLLPLFSPERAVDLIVVCDPYTDDRSINAALAHVNQMYGIVYERDRTYERVGGQLYKPVSGSQLKLPSIIRLCLVGSGQQNTNSTLIENIRDTQIADTRAILQRINPLNFSMSKEQFEAMRTVCTQVVHDNVKTIQSMIRNIIGQQQSAQVSGFGS